jgi:hypothetical protein
MSLLLPVPTSTDAQARVGRAIYNELGLLLTSRRDWFAEGLPCEWLNALDDLQAVLTRAKHRARSAMGPALEDGPRQGDLF